MKGDADISEPERFVDGITATGPLEQISDSLNCGKSTFYHAARRTKRVLHAKSQILLLDRRLRFWGRLNLPQNLTAYHTANI
jgi:hypothetical protein